MNNFTNLRILADAKANTIAEAEKARQPADAVGRHCHARNNAGDFNRRDVSVAGFHDFFETAQGVQGTSLQASFSLAPIHEETANVLIASRRDDSDCAIELLIASNSRLNDMSFAISSTGSTLEFS